jgi:hypothetical protein
MAEGQLLSEEDRIRALDRAWNEIYLRDDRSRFSEILADDFIAIFSDGGTSTKADLMRPRRRARRLASATPYSRCIRRPPSPGDA